MASKKVVLLSTMALSPQTLSQEKLNLLRNSIINFECSSQVYQTILEWGFAKPKGVKIIDHLKYLEIEQKCGRSLKNWLKKYEKALEATDFSSFDVTTLHDLLSVLCYEKVNLTGGKEYENRIKDTNSIEYLLKEVKTMRNDVSHEYAKAIDDPKIEAKQELLRKCIRTAGALYCIDQSAIDAKVADLDAKFNEMMHDTNSSYENAVRHVTNKIERECPTFMLEKYSSLFTVPLPGGLGKIDSSKIFESVNISVAVEGKDENEVVGDATDNTKDGTKMVKTAKKDSEKEKIIFNSSEICSHVSNKFVVINGAPGSGKTTLMRNIFQNILENSVNGSETSYEGIGKYRVPIYLECRTERQNNLRDFLNESIPNFHEPNDVIYNAFKEMKGKVFLIDGYDEVNDKSRELVDEIIPFCRDYNAACIVSGRVDAGNDLISKLKDMSLSYNEMLVEPISKMGDKLSFLRRYGDKMRNVDSDELVKNFENLNDSAQEVFICPVLLALYISLFLNHRSSLSKLHNEQSTYKAIREIFSKDIVKKLKESNVKDPELKAKLLLDVFSDHSLRLFNDGKYYFKEEQLLSLREDCLPIMPNEVVDIKGVFSCILTPETSLKSGKVLTYAFTHSTVQEYLAVGNVIMKMKERKFDWSSPLHLEISLRTQFLACLGVSTSLFGVKKEVKRYGNIIKLLILETIAHRELAKYKKTFTAVFREYFVSMGFLNSSSVSPVFLLDLVSSSNCDSDVVSIVYGFLKDRSYYKLEYPRHFRPMAELMKNRQSKVVIRFTFSESLTDTDCVNFGQLLSVLKEGRKIELRLLHSFFYYQPLNGEFYTQLNNSKCKVTKFTACVTSTEHLSILKRVCEVGKFDKLHISTECVSACDVSFATLEGHGRDLVLMVKYTDGIPSTGSNPVPKHTSLLIADIPADGKNDVKRMINYLSPESKRFGAIYLVKCHLTDNDINEMLWELRREGMRTRWGDRTKVEKWRVNKDKSRDLWLHLRGK